MSGALFTCLADTSALPVDPVVVEGITAEDAVVAKDLVSENKGIIQAHAIKVFLCKYVGYLIDLRGNNLTSTELKEEIGKILNPALEAGLVPASVMAAVMDHIDTKFSVCEGKSCMGELVCDILKCTAPHLPDVPQFAELVKKRDEYHNFKLAMCTSTCNGIADIITSFIAVYGQNMCPNFTGCFKK